MRHWQNRAACAGHPEPDIFTNGHRAHEAKKICRNCPVIDACRAEGQAASVGTWGGEFHELKATASLTLPFLGVAQ